MSDLETIVFRVVDRDAFGEMMKHHMNATPICGLIPIMFASGDRVTIPGEIVEEVSQIDPDDSSSDELFDVVRKADEYLESL
jgi:hypothetical protein